MQSQKNAETIVPIFFLLPFIVLVEGFSSIAVEILTIRQLLPVAGGSVIVTSLIIGIFLLFLALGYDWGGRVKGDLHRVLRINFFIAALWIGVGLSYIFIKYFFIFCQQLLGQQIILPLILYLIVVLAPSIFLLGQTLPVIMNIVRQDRTAGVIAGRALGLSTVGSFLGAIFTTLVLMHYLGVAATVFIVFLSLIILSLLLSHGRESFILKLLLTLASGLLVFVMNISAEKHMFMLTNNHANYQIMTHENSPLPEGSKILMINEVYSSLTTPENRAFEYIEAMRKIIFDDLKMKNAEILVLGAGGFTLSQGDVFSNKFTYVDIDDQLRQVVEPAFIKEIKDKFIAQDARRYLLATKKKYNVIVIDVFSNVNSIPSYLLTYQFMRDIKEHLSQPGYAIFNIISKPFFDDSYSKRVDNTIRSVFGGCAVIPIRYEEGVSNIIYACSNQSDESDHVVYTDNLNTSTTDSVGW